jgi:succinyl-CoA synthetase alpha subunit
MTATRFELVPREYRDSVSLMQLSATLAKLPGIEQASAVMATENNLALLAEAGLHADTAASPTDLLIVVRGREELLASALQRARELLTQPPDRTTTGVRMTAPPRSIQMASEETGGAGMALISTPGEYAAAEALKALRLGLDVMLFSDNVSEQDELRLKQFAQTRELIVMGPDCGTAIVNGVPLAFANVVRRGPIGAIGASGTGLQEVTVLVDRLGLGISQAIGTGGRDLSRSIGGLSMLRALRDLAADEATRVIVLISKPPASDVAERVIAEAAKAGKPVVVNFLGADSTRLPRNLHGAKTLEDAARAAVALANGGAPRSSYDDAPASPANLPRWSREQRYVRGLYSGGTFCYEASLLLDERLPDVYSNTPVRSGHELTDLKRSHHHALIDLGDDVFTRGRPHPMIDYRLRNERVVGEAADPATAVILLDVVLGYGSHADPAAELAPALRRAQEIAGAEGRSIAFVGHICGTDRDPQDLTRQARALKEAGMVLVESNAQAARLAAAMVSGRSAKR